MPTDRPTLISMTETPWTGVVLAGGRSSRMGRDKALLEWQGRPLIEHMQQLLRQAGATRVVVSGHYPQYDAIADRMPGRGPLGGLHSVAEALTDGELLVLPVDMPQLHEHLLHRLLSAPSCACVILAHYRLPMRLRLDQRCRTLLTHLLADPTGPHSLQALQYALQCQSLAASTDDASTLANCNTPAQWQALFH